MPRGNLAILTWINSYIHILILMHEQVLRSILEDPKALNNDFETIPASSKPLLTPLFSVLDPLVQFLADPETADSFTEKRQKDLNQATLKQPLLLVFINPNPVNRLCILGIEGRARSKTYEIMVLDCILGIEGYTIVW